ncbi:hypothetical protein Sango_0796800 [Sesamum angolense]|uniref:Reverse transcriptase RNase H-like domain-containing protein n=1 Tax=Sesamum angolense TaxID=2727404 RepID=A0AAE2C092_9LAMI|nr:hypothetical protein Sango_0796800 [Sesamum angolense]
MMTQRGIEANPLKIKAILDMKAPTNVNEVQKLTGRITTLSRLSLKRQKKIFISSRKKEANANLLCCKVLNGAEGRYSSIEKITLALVITARRLSPYFLSHSIKVKTNVPLKQTLGKADTSDRLVKWAVELRAPTEDALKVEKWLLHMYGSSTTQGSGVGVVITSLYREDLEFAVKFGFEASNNETEYEVFVIGMRMTHEVGARHLVAYLDSQLIVKQVEITYEAKE